MRISGQSILATRLRRRACRTACDPGDVPGLLRGRPARRRSATPSRTCWSITRCATRTSRPGFWRGVNINQNAIYLECFMDELAKEAGVDPLEFRRKLMAKHPKHLGRAQRGGGEDRLGQAGAAPACSAASPSTWATAATWRPPPRSRSSGKQGEDPPHRRRDRSGLRGQPGADRAADRPARSSTASSALFLRRHAPSRTAASSRRTSTPTTRCGIDADAEGRSRSSCRRRRLLGRRRRADDLRGAAGGAQRDLRGDRQALSAAFPLKDHGLDAWRDATVRHRWRNRPAAAFA